MTQHYVRSGTPQSDEIWISLSLVLNRTVDSCRNSGWKYIISNGPHHTFRVNEHPLTGNRVDVDIWVKNP